MIQVNVFCSTGKGGGVDPTCGKGDGASAHVAVQKALDAVGVKLTPGQQGKVAGLNPNGIHGSVLLPQKLKPHAEAIAAGLPHGTKIQFCNAVAELAKLGVPQLMAEQKLAPKPEPKVEVKAVPPKQDPPPMKLEPPTTGAGQQFATLGDVSHMEGRHLPAKATNGSMLLRPTAGQNLQAAQKAVDSLTSAEQAALGNWAGGGYREIRSHYVQGNKAAVADFDSALAKMPTFAGTTYRGLKTGNSAMPAFMSKLTSIGVGGIWTDKAPSSHSRSPKVAASFSDSEDHGSVAEAKSNGPSGVLIITHQKTGKSAELALASKGEAEVISKPGTSYRILKLEHNAIATTAGNYIYNFKHVIHLEEI